MLDWITKAPMHNTIKSEILQGRVDTVPDKVQTEVTTKGLGNSTIVTSGKKALISSN